MSEGQFRGRPAQRPIQRQDPLLQWSSGNVKEIDAKGKRDYTGFYAERGRDEEFDKAMGQVYQPMVIRHSGGNDVKHWLIDDVELIPIISQVDTFQTIKNGPERFGMSIGWINIDGKGQSFLRFLAFLRPIISYFPHPIMVTLKKTVTQDMVNALLRQYDVIEFIEKTRESAGKKRFGYPFYAVSMRLGIGISERRGSTQTTEVAPPINLAPEELNTEYAKSVFIGKDQYLINLVEDMIDQAERWSVIDSKATASQEQGNEDQELMRLGHGVH